ncbi:hypothetical protein [Streptomyces sp. NPDC059743]|uniref:hypothetical protein n=1 Tax=Streptomyces sp. NPDC059743 TaxID=3346928 RepID=UPI0036494DD5
MDENTHAPGTLPEFLPTYLAGLGTWDENNNARSHQGDGLALRAPNDDPTIIPFPARTDRIRLRQRLAGLLNEYRPVA